MIDIEYYHERTRGIFASETEVWRLIEALDERGQREKALKTHML